MPSRDVVYLQWMLGVCVGGSFSLGNRDSARQLCQGVLPDLWVCRPRWNRTGCTWGDLVAGGPGRVGTRVIFSFSLPPAPCGPRW